MSKVSIITPIYNVEGYLEKCVDSALSQTERDIEIILVDDGSTDSSGKICDALASKDSRIKVLHKENGGVSDTRNAGLSMAESDYIMFLDSDDTYERNTVETALRAVLSENADMAVFNFHAVGENGEELYNEQNGISGVTNLIETPGVLLTSPALWNKIFKRSLFTGEEFPKDYWYEDFRVVSKMYYRCKKIAYADGAPLYNYLLRAGSIMHNTRDIDKIKSQRIVAANDVRDFYIENGLYEKLRDELDWLYIYHGYFLPCREIMSAADSKKANALMDELRLNLDKTVPGAESNKYFYRLSKKEKMLFKLFYTGKYGVLNAMLKIKNKL